MTAGEQWAAEELDALRTERFTPGAWTHFLGASFRRAADTRRARPELARQARGWSILGLCAGLAVRRWAPPAKLATPRPRSFMLWWLAVSAMLEWHLGMVEGPGGEPRQRLSAADALTLTRLWSIPLVAAQGDPAAESGPAFAALIGSLAASDALDGALARRAGPTRLGRDLDKAADALLVSVASHAASRAGWLSTHTARLATARSLLPVAVAAGSYFATGQRPAVDSIGLGRRLAPALLGGLAIAPFARRAGESLTAAASAAALALAVAQRTAHSRPGRRREDHSRLTTADAQHPQPVRRRDATSNRADRQHSAASRADRGRARGDRAGRG